MANKSYGDMHGKRVLITGANSGIGKETAIGLAGLGAAVVIVSRDEARGNAAAKDIQQQSNGSMVDVLIADMSLMASVRALAATYRQRYNRLDVLLNNAGGITSRRKVTVDGFEETFARNYLGVFLLTNELLDLMKQSAPSRIITVASMAERFGSIHFNDLQSEHNFTGMGAYSQSKLAMVMFTYELARRLEGTSVTANTLHPGFVRSNFGQGEPGPLAVAMRLVMSFAISSRKAAETSIYLASSPEVANVTGTYFERKTAKKSSHRSFNITAQQRLWQMTDQMLQQVGTMAEVH